MKERKLSGPCTRALLSGPDCGGDMASFRCCDFPTVVDRHLDLTERNPFLPKLLLLKCFIAATETKLGQKLMIFSILSDLMLINPL